MKRKVCMLLMVLALMVLTFAMFVTGCNQATAHSFGGDMTLELKPGEKLEEITWKEDSLWYLTRPMREGEQPETHVFQQSSEFGLMEGTVTVVESKK